MKLCMIFTEGPHDVAFIKKVLKICCNANEQTGIKISEFPKPLDLMFQGYIRDREMQDLSLDMAQKFFLPEKVFIRDDWFITLFYTGGKDNIENVRNFLSDFHLVLKTKLDFVPGFTEIKYIFINDADTKNYIEVQEDMKKAYFPITDSDTGDIYLTADKCNFYVWHNSNGLGTLEDILIEILKSSDNVLYEKSNEYISNCFENLKKANDIPTIAKKYKATLTCAGQGKSAGASLSSILIRGKLFKEESIVKNEYAIDFSNFLNSILI